MADDLSDKLKGMLENPDILNLIGNLASGAGLGDNAENSAEITQNDAASSIKAALNSINTHGDNRITLLNALKPYMREGRAKHIDTAIKILKISKISSVFKDL